MALSSNSLIHFTKSKSSLKGILENDFRVKYCLEKVKTKNLMFDFAIPMVSFCDIPLSEIKNHQKNYGCYGIGLTKNWAKMNGLNPVLYLDTHSNLAEHTLDVIYDKTFTNSNSTLNKTKLALADFFRYVKNYQAPLIRNKKMIDKNYRFSDEREWRYCPEKSSLKGNPYIIDDEKTYKNYIKTKNSFNNKLDNIRLSFSPDDITYIIINDDSEIIEIIQHLEKCKGKRFSLEQIRRLTTRILTTSQIKSDI